MASSIGVVAISYNEEKDINAFLENVLSWAHEVIIVDDGSTDDTKAIATSYGSKVKFLESPRAEGEYYADQRNKGIDASVSDWLLHMDIDERVPKKLLNELQLVISSNKFDAFKFKRTNYFLHRPMKGGGWNDWNLVHFAKRDVLRFSGMFHEKIELSISDNRIGQLHSPMIHLNDETFSERLRKSNNYQEEFIQRIRKSGRNVNALFLLKSFFGEFLVKYVYKQGFKDGILGLIWAMHAATARYRAAAIVWDEQNRISREELEEQLKGE